MKYLILGAKGIIGSALTKYLKSQGHVVFEFDILLDENQDLRKSNNEILNEYLKQSDFVYFLACDIGGANYIKEYQNKFEFIHNNVSILKETFEILNKYSLPFIFSSSEMSNMKHSSYGCIKSVGEYYCKSLNSPVVKLWNVYGIESKIGNKNHVITDFIEMAQNNNEIKMVTDGEEERQLLFSHDCCECLETLSKIYYKIPQNQEIHIAQFKWNKILDVAKEVSYNFNNVKIIPGKLTDQTHKSEKYEPNRFILDYWIPKTSLSEGIKIISDYYKK